MASSCKELTHWKRLWCWEGLGAGEKGTTEGEMAGWHHWLDGLESEWTPGVGDWRGGLACCDSWGRKESDTTEWLNWTELNGLMVFPTFFNLSLNLAKRSSWSAPYSSPSLVFADCIELLHLGCKEYNQSDFGVDHLVMSVCRVLSCVVGRGCLLWPVHSLGKSLLSLHCFILYCKAKFACYSKCFLTSYFCIPVPIRKRTSFSSRRSCISS